MFLKIVPDADAGVVKIVEVGVIVIVMETVEIETVVEVIGIVVAETEMIGTVVEEGIGTGEADVTIVAAEMIEIAGGETIGEAVMIEIGVDVTIAEGVMIEKAVGVMTGTVVGRSNSISSCYKFFNYGIKNPSCYRLNTPIDMKL